MICWRHRIQISPVFGKALQGGATSLAESLRWIIASYRESPREAFAGSVPYLEMWGIVCGGWQMGRAAPPASKKLATNEGDAVFMRAKIVTARYYAEALLPKAQALAAEVIEAGTSTLAFAAKNFRTRFSQESPTWATDCGT